MNKITIAETLIMLAEIFEEPMGNLALEVLREDLPGWDSMGALALMAELDERFDIVLTADESREMVHVDDIVKLLRQHDLIAD